MVTLSFFTLVNVIASTIPSLCISNQIVVSENGFDRAQTLTVQTPNGSYVNVAYSSGATFDPSEVNQVFDSISSLNIRFREPSSLYNCHSYAWHKQRVSQVQYWMNDPWLYYNDGSYYEVSFDSASPGDKVCYFDSYYNNLHSAILVGKEFGTPNGVCGASNLIYIQSKWGNAGLYHSRGDRTPYTSNHGGDATSIKFYKRNSSHSHSFSYEQISGGREEDYHFRYCSCTGYYEQHSYTPYYGIGCVDEESGRYFPAYICTQCNYISYMQH